MLVAGIAIAGCSTDSTAPPSQDAASDVQFPTVFPSRLPPDFHCDPTLASLSETVFAKACALDSCHGSNNAVYNLILDGNAQNNEKALVGVAAQSCKGWTRVVPGDVAKSFLWQKLTEPKPACGLRMPEGYEPLPDAALSCFRGWIESL